MRTALILLLLLAVASAVGSVIPQIPNSPEKVAAFLADHELVGRFYLRAGLFDVFGSWWFALIAVLLITSLVACLLPRSRAHLRAIRQRPVQARELDALPMYREIDVVATPEEAATAVRGVLRRRRFRVAAAGTSIAAEKGALREAGSLIFHWAFLLLLVGAIVGKGTGYSGRATIVEGESWTDAAINYDPVHLRTGRYFGGDFSGLGLRLLRYDDDFDETGLPTRFISTVELLDRSGDAVGRTDVEVNHPARFEDLRIHQYGFGWAPVITVERGGQALWDGPVVMSQRTAAPIDPSSPRAGTGS
jgi:cytochrome c biogenesis protein